MEFVTALPADLTAKTVWMPIPAPLASLLTQRLLIINASAQPSSSLMAQATVFLVPMAARSAPQPPSATAASVLSCSKAAFVKQAATTASPYLDQNVLVVLLDVSNALKT
jgi:hypothetical protein